MIDDRKALQLLGESVREVGILVLVFAPLDAFFQEEVPHIPVIAAVVASALLFVAIGIMLESEA